MHSGDEPVGLCDTGLPTRFLLSATALSKNKEAEGCKGVREGGELRRTGRHWTACSGVLFNCFQCSGLLCLFFVVFFVQFRLCNQRLLCSLRLRSVLNGGWGTVSPCPPKLCFAVTGSHTLWNVSVRKVHTSALLLLTPVLLLFTCIPPYP